MPGRSSNTRPPVTLAVRQMTHGRRRHHRGQATAQSCMASTPQPRRAAYPGRPATHPPPPVAGPTRPARTLTGPRRPGRRRRCRLGTTAPSAATPTMPSRGRATTQNQTGRPPPARRLKHPRRPNFRRSEAQTSGRSTSLRPLTCGDRRRSTLRNVDNFADGKLSAGERGRRNAAVLAVQPRAAPWVGRGRCPAQPCDRLTCGFSTRTAAKCV